MDSSVPTGGGREAEWSRRMLLGRLCAGGAGFAVSRSFAQTGAPGRLDLHHHFASPKFKALLMGGKRTGWQVMQPYDPVKDLETMEKGGVSTALLSMTTPGAWVGDDFGPERERAISITRDMNDYGARLAADHKGRFGLFAALPLPDIDASLKEIAYAFDVLKADGLGLLTSYGNQWLGEKIFEPIFSELNRRKAVVYVHPTDAPCCHNLAKASPATFEWLADTARCIMSMVSGDPNLISGTGEAEASPATRYADCKFIWSHGGGALIGVSSRVVGTVTERDLSGSPAVNSRLYHIRRFFYDTAGSANPIIMQGIAKLAGASQIVFGTDYPFGDPSAVANGMQSVGFTAAQLRAIDRDNALRILPQYK